MDSPAAGTATSLDALIAHLHANGRPRVWSIVVTVFGDAIVPRGGRVALSVLQDLMARIAIEPGALRTAMSRLAADGWVKRQREGRNSFFRLAESGRHAFDLATRRIYASGPPHWDGGWTVVVTTVGGKPNSGDELLATGFVKLSDTVFLRPDTDAASLAPPSLDGMLVIRGTSPNQPEMLRDLWPCTEIADAYRGFIENWAPVKGAIAADPLPSPLEAMAMRTLLVHDWRRIVLRDPGLPLALLPNDWPGEEARTTMRAIYGHLAGPSEAWLNDAGLPAGGGPAIGPPERGRSRIG